MPSNPGQAVEVVADVEGAGSDLDFLQSGQFLVHATEFSIVCDRGSLRMQFLEYRCFTVSLAPRSISSAVSRPGSA